MFQFLRKGEEDVNILRYLPEFLTNDKVFKGIADGCSQEHQVIKLLIINMAKQFFIETATWGLNDWERVLGVTTVNSDSYQIRRNRILLKMQACQTSTVEFIKELINRYMVEPIGNVIEYNSENKFEIIVDSDKVLNYKAMINAIETYKPAHLAMYLAVLIFMPIKIHHRAECQQIVDAHHNIWNLGSIRTSRRDGEFNRDGTTRRTGKHPDENYKDQQTHRAEIDLLVESTLTGTHTVNRRNGTHCRDGSHRRNGTYRAGMIGHACTITTIKNGIEVIEYV